MNAGRTCVTQARMDPRVRASISARRSPPASTRTRSTTGAAQRRSQVRIWLAPGQSDNRNALSRQHDPRARELATTQPRACIARVSAPTRPGMLILYRRQHPFGRTTFDVGARYDQQWGASLPSTHNPTKPTQTWYRELIRRGRRPIHMEERLAACRRRLRPGCGAQDYPASELQPVRRTAEHRLFAFANPSSQAGYVEYPWKDLNGNHLAEANEVDTSTVSVLRTASIQRLPLRWHRPTSSIRISRRPKHNRPYSVSIVSSGRTSAFKSTIVSPIRTTLRATRRSPHGVPPEEDTWSQVIISSDRCWRAHSNARRSVLCSDLHPGRREGEGWRERAIRDQLPGIHEHVPRD